MKPAEPEGASAGAGSGELELQARWAAGDWEGPWLEAAGGPARVAFAGTWNRGAGPDFRGAILLDREGRARRTSKSNRPDEAQQADAVAQPPKAPTKAQPQKQRPPQRKPLSLIAK